MGQKLSSNNDFNPILTTQPRRSIDIRKFEIPNTSQQQSFSRILSIPVVVNNSEIKSGDANTAFTLPNEPSVVNEHFKPIQTKTQANPHQSIETTLSSFINNPTQEKTKKDRSLQKLTEPSSSHIIRSKSPKHHQAINGDTTVISRSVINSDDHRYLKNHHSSSFQPYSIVVEHNGKQFLVEIKERTELRHVQFIDEITHQMKCFEVIDCIPCRIVRPYRRTSQSLPPDNTSENTSVLNLQLGQRSTVPPAPHFQSSQGSIIPPVSILRSSQRSIALSVPTGQSETVTPLNSIYNHANPAKDELQHNNVNIRSSNNTPESSYYESSVRPSSSQRSLIPRISTQTAADTINSHPEQLQPKLSKSSSIDPQNISNRYTSLRTQTPIRSDDGAYSFAAYSSELDEEANTEGIKNSDQIVRSEKNHSGYTQTNSSDFIHRNNTAVSYGVISGRRSSTPFDPFARPVNPNDGHYYRKPYAMDNYAEPIINNRKFQQPANPDYAPLPITIKQPKPKQYYSSHVSSKTVYNG